MHLFLKGFEPSIIVNNAGVHNKGKSIIQSTPDEISRVIDTNLYGTIWLTKVFLPFLVRQKSSHIVLLIS